MRWSAIGLLALGIVAALGAALLVSSIRDPRGRALALAAEGGQGPQSASSSVAAALQPGMRAVTLGLEARDGIGALLVPGSVVDVLASVAIAGQPVSMTLLQRVEVLSAGERAGRPHVVLVVDSEQAEELALVQEEGSVSLALRHPDDEEPVAVRLTRLGQLGPATPEPPRAPAPQTAPQTAIGRRSGQRDVVVLKGGESEIKTVRDAESPR